VRWWFVQSRLTRCERIVAARTQHSTLDMARRATGGAGPRQGLGGARGRVRVWRREGRHGDTSRMTSRVVRAVQCLETRGKATGPWSMLGSKHTYTRTHLHAYT
jgi:hypothetical protein